MSISNLSMGSAAAAAAAAAPVYTGGGGGEHVAYDGGGGVSAAAPAEFEVPAATVSVSASAVSAGGRPGREKAELDDAELEKIMEEPVRQANKALRPYDRMIEREIHPVTKSLMYTIKDTKTNEVIAEYPPRKIQDMIAKMWELAGLLVDQKA